MNNNDTYKIGAYTIVAILVTFIGTTAVLFTPSTAAAAAKQDAWLASFAVLPLAIYVVYVSSWLGSLFPDKGFVEYLPLILGKFLGKLLGLGYILFFFWFTITVISESTILFYGVALFRLTPMLAVALLGIIASSYAVFSGIESISRSIWYLWIITVVLFALAVLQIMPLAKLSALLPIGESGWKAIGEGSLLSMAFRGELLYLLIIYPFLRSRRDALAGGLVTAIILTIFISLTIVLCISIMGIEGTSRNRFSIFSLVDYLETTGIKIYLTTVWILVFWGKITLSQFAVTLGLAQLCGFKSNQALVLPIAMLLLIMSQASYPSSVELFTHVGDTFPAVALTFEYLIPTLLLLTAVIKKKMGMLDNQPRQTQEPEANQAQISRT